MHQWVRTIAVALLVLFAGVAGAQTPDFSGKWLVAEAPEGGRGGFGGLGQATVIKQDATTLTIIRTTQMGEFTSVYKLDGSESRNTLNVQRNAIEQVSKTRWDGKILRVDTTMTFDGNPVQVTMALALDSPGTLIVESTRPDFQGGGAPITTKTTYKRAE